ncbi:MAG: hypothetical protein AAB401_17530, partial [Acidobacteriota bacterium]
MNKRFAALAIAVLCVVSVAPYLSILVSGQGISTSPSMRAEVTLPDHVDVSPQPLRDMHSNKKPPLLPRGGKDFQPGRPLPVGNSNPSVVDELVAKSIGFPAALVDPKAATNGTPVDPTYAVAPPDTTGDLGPNHYVQWVNLRYSIYTLTRDAGNNNNITAFNLVSGFPKNGNVVWQGFGGKCENDNDGDPIVQYDQLADRWVLTQFAVSGSPYTQCVAVSTSPDPTGTYYRYSYSYGTDFNDYPKMGVWPNAYYITYNIFRNGSTFRGNKVCAFERSQMLVGATARQVCAQTSRSYHSLLPADLEGTTLPPTNSPNFLLSIGTSTLQYWKFTVNWAGSGSGTLTGPTTISGAA